MISATRLSNTLGNQKQSVNYLFDFQTELFAGRKNSATGMDNGQQRGS